jgi:hypothetical protein
MQHERTDDMDDTRAVATLPNLEIEIRHRKDPEERAEYLSVTLKATPDLDAVAMWLDPARMMRAWLAFNPWLAAWPMPLPWRLAPPRRENG